MENGNERQIDTAEPNDASASNIEPEAEDARSDKATSVDELVKLLPAELQ